MKTWEELRCRRHSQRPMHHYSVPRVACRTPQFSLSRVLTLSSSVGTGAGQRRAVRVWLSGKLWLGLRSADVLCCAVLRVNSHLLGGVVMNIECGRVETGRDAARAQPV